MIARLISILLFYSLACVSTAQLYPTLIPFRVKDKWGYSNSKGKLQIKPQFQTAEFFYHQLAVVSFEGKYGVINPTGKWVIEPIYKSMIRDNNGYRVSTFKGEEFMVNGNNERVERKESNSYKTIKEKLVTNLKKEIKTVTLLEENIYVASYDTLYTVIENNYKLKDEMDYRYSEKEIKAQNYFLCDEKGTLLSKPSLLYISKLFKHHYLMGGIGGGSKIIRLNNGKLDSTILVSSPEFGLYRMVEKGQWMILDTTNATFILCKPEIVSLSSCNNNCLMATIQYKDRQVKQLLTTKGEVFSDEYQMIGDYTNNMCLVYNNGWYGYIDIEGKLAIPLQYNLAFGFKEELALVEMSGDFFYINKMFNKVIDVEYTYEQAIGQSKRAGKTNISDAEYFGFSNGLAVFEKNGKYGYINKVGAEVIPARYDMAEPFRNGFACVYMKSDSATWLYNYSLIGTTGQIFYTFKYNASIESTSFYAIGFMHSNTVAFKKFHAVYDVDGFVVFNQEGKKITTNKVKNVYRDLLPSDNLLRVSMADPINFGYINVDGKCYFKD